MFKIFRWKSSSAQKSQLDIIARIGRVVRDRFRPPDAPIIEQVIEPSEASQVAELADEWNESLRVSSEEVYRALHEALIPFRATINPGDIDSKVCSAINEYRKEREELYSELSSLFHKFMTSGKYLTLFDPEQLGHALAETIISYAREKKIDPQELINRHGGEEKLIGSLLGLIKLCNVTPGIVGNARRAIEVLSV